MQDIYLEGLKLFEDKIEELNIKHNKHIESAWNEL